jgi:hypothetical protein
LVFILEPKTSYEEEYKGNTDATRPLGTRRKKEELAYLKGGKEVSFQEYASIATKIGE